MAWRNRKGKSGGGSKGKPRNPQAKDLGGGKTEFKTKAFGKQEVTRVFKESDVLRDAQGRFVDKPGQGEAPQYKGLKKAKKNIQKGTKSGGQVNNPRYKQMQRVLKRVKSHLEAKEDRYKEKQKQFPTTDELKSQVLNVIKKSRFSQDPEIVRYKQEIQKVLEEIQLRQDVEDWMRLNKVGLRKINPVADTEINGLIRPLTRESSIEEIKEQTLRDIANALGISYKRIYDLANPEERDKEIRERAKQIREDLIRKLKELQPRPEEPELFPEPVEPEPKKPEPQKPETKPQKPSKKKSDYKEESLTKEQATSRKNVIASGSKPASKVTLRSIESVEERLRILSEILGEDVVREMNNYLDPTAFSAKSFSKLQKDLIKRAYKDLAREKRVPDDMEINWKNLKSLMTEKELETFIFRWQQEEQVSKYIKKARWTARRSKSSSFLYTDAQQTKKKYENALKIKERGDYKHSTSEENKVKEGQVKDYIKEGVKKNLPQVYKKAQEALKKAADLTPEEVEVIKGKIFEEVLEKVADIAETLSIRNGTIEEFEGRLVVNPASPYPEELIPFTPATALHYMREKLLNEIANNSTTSVSYSELLHGNIERKISEVKSRKSVYELHHIEQFAHRLEDGSPILIYDTDKAKGSMRGMIQADFNNLYGEETPNGRRYYVSRVDKDGKEVRSYLARSPYEDDSDVTIGENGRVQKGGKDSVSPVREKFGTDESYIDLRGASHRNKEYIYSLIHPLTSLENNSALKAQMNALNEIARERGDKELQSRYLDADFISVGVGKYERDLHDKFRANLMLVRKAVTVERIEAELAKRPRDQRAEVLGRYGFVEDMAKTETDNYTKAVKTFEELTRVVQAYKNLGLVGGKRDDMEKQLVNAKTRMEKAKKRMDDILKEAEEMESNYGDIINSRTQEEVKSASSKFLYGRITDPKVWGLDGTETSGLELRNRILAQRKPDTNVNPGDWKHDKRYN